MLISRLFSAAVVASIIALLDCVPDVRAETSSRLPVVHRLPRAEVFDLAWSPDGRYLAAESASGRGYIVWNAKTGKKVRELAGDYGPSAGRGPLLFTPDGQHLIVLPSPRMTVAGERVGFALWNIETGAIDRKVTIPFAGHLEHGAVSVSRDQLAVIYDGRDAPRHVTIYSTSSWEIVNTRVPRPTKIYAPTGFAFSPDGSRIAMSDSAPGEYRGQPMGTIWIYDAPSGAIVRTIEGAHADRPTFLSFTTDHRHLVSAAGQYGTSRNELTKELEVIRDGDPVRIWDTASGEKVKSFALETGHAYSLAVSSDGNFVVFGAATKVRNTPGHYRLWNLKSGALIQTFDGLKEMRAAAFSPDSRYLALRMHRNRDEIVVLELPR
jgi:WD40 repeat protein